MEFGNTVWKSLKTDDERNAYAKGFNSVINQTQDIMKARAAGEKSLAAFQLSQPPVQQAVEPPKQLMQNPFTNNPLQRMFGSNRNPSQVTEQDRTAASWQPSGKTGIDYFRNLSEQDKPGYSAAYNRFTSSGMSHEDAMTAAQQEIESGHQKAKDAADGTILMDESREDLNNVLGNRQMNGTDMWNTFDVADQDVVLRHIAEARATGGSVVDAIYDGLDEIGAAEKYGANQRWTPTAAPAAPKQEFDFDTTQVDRDRYNNIAQYGGKLDANGNITMDSDEYRALMAQRDELVRQRDMTMDDDEYIRLDNEAQRMTRELDTWGIEEKKAYDAAKNAERTNPAALYDPEYMAGWHRYNGTDQEEVISQLQEQRRNAQDKYDELNVKLSGSEQYKDTDEYRRMEREAALYMLQMDELDAQIREAEGLREQQREEFLASEEGQAWQKRYEETQARDAALAEIPGAIGDAAGVFGMGIQQGVMNMSEIMAGALQYANDSNSLLGQLAANVASTYSGMGRMSAEDMQAVTAENLARGRQELQALRNDVTMKADEKKKAIVDTYVDIEKSFWTQKGWDLYGEMSAQQGVELLQFINDNLIEATGIQIGQQLPTILVSLATGGAGEGLAVLTSPEYFLTFVGEFCGELTEAYDSGKTLSTVDLLCKTAGSLVNSYIEYGGEGEEGYRAGVTRFLDSIKGEIGEELKQGAVTKLFDDLADVIQGREVSHPFYSSELSDEALINLDEIWQTVWQTALTTTGMNITHAGTFGIIQKIGRGQQLDPEERASVQEVANDLEAQEQHDAFEQAANGDDNVTDKSIEDLSDELTLPPVEEVGAEPVVDEETQSAAEKPAQPTQLPEAERPATPMQPGNLYANMRDSDLQIIAQKMQENPAMFSQTVMDGVNSELRRRGMPVKEDSTLHSAGSQFANEIEQANALDERLSRLTRNRLDAEIRRAESGQGSTVEGANLNALLLEQRRRDAAEENAALEERRETRNQFSSWYATLSDHELDMMMDAYTNGDYDEGDIDPDALREEIRKRRSGSTEGDNLDLSTDTLQAIVDGDTEAQKDTGLTKAEARKRLQEKRSQLAEEIIRTTGTDALKQELEDRQNGGGAKQFDNASDEQIQSELKRREEYGNRFEKGTTGGEAATGQQTSQGGAQTDEQQRETATSEQPTEEPTREGVTGVAEGQETEEQATGGQGEQKTPRKQAQTQTVEQEPVTTITTDQPTANEQPQGVRNEAAGTSTEESASGGAPDNEQKMPQRITEPTTEQQTVTETNTTEQPKAEEQPQGVRNEAAGMPTEEAAPGGAPEDKQPAPQRVTGPTTEQEHVTETSTTEQTAEPERGTTGTAQGTEEEQRADGGEQYDADTQRIAKKNNYKFGATKGDGSQDTGLHVRTNISGMSKAARMELQLVDRVAKRFGFSVEITDPMEYHANGKYAGGRTLYIASDTQNPVTTVAGHEMYHMVRNINHEAGNRIMDIYTDWARRTGYDLDSAIAKVQDLYKKRAGQTLDRDAALEEVVADSFYRFFSDENTLRRVYNTDHSLYNRVMDFVRQVQQSIQQMLSRYEQNTPEAAMLKKQAGAFDDLYGNMLDVLEEMRGLDEVKRGAAGVTPNGDMTRTYTEKVKGASNMRTISNAANDLAKGILRKTGNAVTDDNIDHVIDAATGLAEDRKSIPSTQMQRNSLRYDTNDAEVNRALHMLGAYAYQLERTANTEEMKALRAEEQMIDMSDPVAVARHEAKKGADADPNAAVGEDFSDSQNDTIIQDETPEIKDIHTGTKYSHATYDERDIKPGLSEKKAKELGIQYETKKLPNSKKKAIYATGRDVLAAVMRKNGIDPKQTIEFMDKVDNWIKHDAVAKFTYVGLQDVNDAKMIIDRKTGQVVMSCRVKNGDYDVNFDFTKICKKRVAFSSFIDELGRREGKRGGANMLEEIRLNSGSLFRMNEILRDMGYETACLGCFVEARRYGVRDWAQRIVDEWNAAVLKVNPNAEYFGFSGSDTTIEKLSEGEVIRAYEEMKKYAKDKAGIKSPSLKMPVLAKQPSMQKLLRVSDLITSQGRTELHKYSAELESIVASRSGTASPKSVEAFTPYNSEIELLDDYKGRGAKKMRMTDYIKSIAGARSQSFSDFIMTHVFDHLQKTAGLAARKMTAHTYTKEVSRAILFGMTGEKHNMSIMFEIDPEAGWENAGLDKNGEYIVADYEHAAQVEKLTGKKQFTFSFPWKRAVEIEHDPQYSKSCGIIGVGYSYNGLIKMLRDNVVPYIIGYHRSGMPKEVLIASNVKYATDYTPVQNTMKLSSFKHVKNAEAGNGVPTYATWAQQIVSKDIENTSATYDLKAALKRNGGDAIKTMQEFLKWMGDNELTAVTEKATLNGNEQKGHGDFDLYGDLEKTKNPRRTANNYIAWCIENDMMPLFYEFAGEDGYYKFLPDFSVTDLVTGEYAGQQPVSMEPLLKMGIDKWLELAEHYMSSYNSYMGQQYSSEKYESTLNQIYNELAKDGTETYAPEDTGEENEYEAKYSLPTETRKRDVFANTEQSIDQELPHTKDEIYQKEQEYTDETRRLFAELKQFKQDSVGYVDRISSKDPEISRKAIEEYKALEVKADIAGKQEKIRENRKAVERLEKQAKALRVLDLRETIRKSGLSQEEYFGKAAVKEFGYTPYFYDAGYILPNGKMLNFSGEKGRHFGMRGEDHRGISTIFEGALESGTEALNAFVNMGNIRIMDESPGVDISVSVKLTPEQRTTLRRHIRQRISENGYYVDFTTDDGRTLTSLEYSPNTNAEKILADIDYVQENGEAPRQSDVANFHTMYSLPTETRRRDTEYMQAVESGDEQKQRELVDQAAKEAGYTLAGYHGTKQPTLRYDTLGFGEETDYKNKRLPFTVFKAGQSGGIYIASNRDVSKGFAKNFNGNPGTVMSLYVRFQNPLIVNEHVWTSVPRYYNIPTPTVMKEAGYTQETVGTEEISLFAQERGYDGVIIEGIREGTDTQTDDYIAFSPEQIKLADPVVYDDQGNVIPLSERFNQQEKDIRYSLPDNQEDAQSQIDEAPKDAETIDVLNQLDDVDTRIEQLNADLEKVMQTQAGLIRDQEKVQQLPPEKRPTKLEKLKADLKQARADARQANRELSKALREKERLLARLDKKDEKIAAMRRKIDEIKQRNRENNRKAAERRRMSKVDVKNRKRLNDTFARLQRMIASPQPGKYVPMDKMRALHDLMEAAIFADRRALSRTAERWLTAVDDMRTSADWATANTFDQALVDQMHEAINLLREKDINQLKGAELKYVADVFTDTLHQIMNATKMIDRERNAEIYEEAKDAVKTNNSQKGISRNGFLRGLQGITMQHLSPKRFINMLANYGDNAWSRIGEDLIEGQRKQERAKQLMLDEIRGLTQGKNADDFRRFVGKNAELIDTGVKDKHGRGIKITKAQRVSLYLDSLNEDNMRHFVYEATLPDQQVLKTGKKARAYENALAMRLINPADYENMEDRIAAVKEKLDEITAGMTDYEKAWVAAYQRIARKSTGFINETSMKQNGYEKATVENYFPIKTDKNFIKQDFESIVRDGSLDNMGSLKERMHGTNPLVIEDVTDVINRMIDNTALYYGFAIPVRNFNKMYNATIGAYQDSVKASVKRTWGTEGANYLEKLLGDIQGNGKTEERTFLDSLRSAQAGAVLTLNPSVMMKQAASLPTAAATLGWRPILRSLRDVGRVDDALINKYTSALLERANGGIRDMEANAQRNTAAKRGIFRLTNGIQAIDLMTVKKVWKAAEYYIQEQQPSLKKGTDEYYEAVARVWETALEDTQPEYGVMQRPHILRSNNQLVRSLTMFKTQSLQNFNILFDAAGDLRAKQAAYKQSPSAENKAALDAAKTKMARAVSSQVVSAVVLSLMTALGKALLHKPEPYQDDKGEITAESAGYQLTKDMVSSMAGMMVGGSELFDLITGIAEGKAPYDIEAGNISLLNDMYQSVYKLGNAAAAIGDSSLSTDKKRQKISKAVDTFLTNVVSMYGVPAANIKKIKDSAEKYVDDITSGRGLEGLTTGDVTLSTAARYMGEALQKGDQDTYTRLYNRLLQSGKDASQINSALRTWMKTGDERVRQAAEAIDSGDLDTYNRLINEMTDDGLGMANAIKAIEAVRKSMSEEEQVTAEAPVEEMTYEQIMKSLEGDEDVYTYAQMNQLLENGNVQAAKKIQSALFKSKGTAKVKSALTSYWKPLYTAAYHSKNRAELNRITKLLKAMGYSDASLAKWKTVDASGGNKNSSKTSRFGGSFGTGFGSSSKKSTSRFGGGFGR